MKISLSRKKRGRNLAAPDSAERALAARLRQGARMLRVERLWRAGAGLAALAFGFLAVSWLGLWLELGPIGRMIGVAAFIIAAAAVLVRDFFAATVRLTDVVARVDANAAPGFRPAASLLDRLADQPDGAAAALWAAHRRQLAKAMAQAPIDAPDPQLPRRDPYALRALALLAALAAGFSAPHDKAARIAAAFDWRGVSAGAPARFDAWIDPPPYTGKPSIALSAKDLDAASPLAAPIHSTLHARLPSTETIEVSGALAPSPEPEKKTASRSAPALLVTEKAYRLEGPARLTLADGRAFAFDAIADRAPTIELKEPPRLNLRGTLALAHRTDDDYGVTGAEAVVSRPGAPRALFDPPISALTLPASSGGIGDAKSTLDFSDSPYAGARVTMTLRAHDAGGNVGESRPFELVLPQRRFSKPLAKALAEQRRDLALDPDHRMRVAVALEALSLSPELFDTSAAVHLGLRAARAGLAGKRRDDELREVADLLWTMALDLEGGDTSAAERDLRAAEKALQEAVANGADEEEIAKRTQELKQALDKFLQQLAEQAARNNPRQKPQLSQGPSRAMNAQDLQAMLDAIAKATKEGDLAQAQKLLQQLQSILENLQPTQAGSGGSAEGAKALAELDRLAREEQQLRDDTFARTKPPEEGAENEPPRPSRNGRRGGSSRGADAKAQPHGAPSEPSESAAHEAARQKALRERLDKLRETLKRGGEDGESLSQAGKAMQQAESALADGEEKGKAVEAEGRALKALREGANQLAESMKSGGQQAGAEGGGEGDMDAPGPGRQHGPGGDRDDPLGRPSGMERGYDANNPPPTLRARRVRDELRRRLGQPERPEEELDYLQRLLQRR